MLKLGAEYMANGYLLFKINSVFSKVVDNIFDWSYIAPQKGPATPV